MLCLLQGLSAVVEANANKSIGSSKVQKQSSLHAPFQPIRYQMAIFWPSVLIHIPVPASDVNRHVESSSLVYIVGLWKVEDCKGDVCWSMAANTLSSRQSQHQRSG